MKKPDDIDQAMEQQAKAKLDEQLNDVPASVKSQLQLARMRAVAAAEAQSHKSTIAKNRPAANVSYGRKALFAIAASAALALPLMWVLQQSDNQDAPLLADLEADQMATPELEPSEVLLQLATLSDEDLAIVQELEFIAWLNDQAIDDVEIEQPHEQRS